MKHGFAVLAFAGFLGFLVFACQETTVTRNSQAEDGDADSAEKVQEAGEEAASEEGGEVAEDACSDGESECRGTEKWRCYSGAWAFNLDCTDTGRVCRNGSCQDSDGDMDDWEHGNECVEDQVRCWGGSVEQCVNGWYNHDSASECQSVLCPGTDWNMIGCKHDYSDCKSEPDEFLDCLSEMDSRTE